MIACSSPCGTLSEIESDATTPPKRLLKASISSNPSGTARPHQQAVDAAAREQHDQKEQGAEHELPILVRVGGVDTGDDREQMGDGLDQRRQDLLEHQKRDSTEYRTEHRAHAAQHRHDD